MYSKWHKFLAAMALLAMVSTVLLACGAPATEPTTAPEEPVATQAPAEEATQASQEPAPAADWATQPMEELTTVVFSVESGAMESTISSFAAEIKEKLNIDVQTVGNPLAQQYEVQMLDLSSGGGQYDIVSYWPMYAADFKQFLAPLKDIAPGGAEQVAADLKMDDMLPGYLWAVEYDGNVYSVQYDGDVKLIMYRRDLMLKPEEQAAFKEKFGYDFPDMNNLTWDQYDDIAAFFYRPDEDFYGTAEIAGFASSTFFTDRYIGRGGRYFNYDTMEAFPDRDICVQTLEEEVALIDTASAPEAHSFEFEDARNQIISEDRVFMIRQWSDVWKWANDPNLSKQSCNIWLAEVPGVEQDGKVIHRDDLGGGGRVMSINGASKNKEAAYKVLVFFADPTRSSKLVSNNDTWTDPSRESHLDPTLYSHLCQGCPENCDNFVKVLRDSANHGVAFLPIPGVGRYFETAERWTKKAFAKQSTPEETCEGLAQEFTAIVDEMGRDEQTQAYRAWVDTWLKPYGVWPEN